MTRAPFSVLTTPTDGRATFHRLSVAGLRAMLRAGESASPIVPTTGLGAERERDVIDTYLRPLCYVERGLGIHREAHE